MPNSRMLMMGGMRYRAPYPGGPLNPAVMPFNPPPSLEVKPTTIQGANGEFKS